MKELKKGMIFWIEHLENKTVHNREPCTITREKSVESAEKLRQDGNRIYASCHLADDFENVYAYYSQSIANAPAYSREMALAYSNLSAVLHRLQKYSECLEAIECCLSSDYPEQSKFKIYLRKIECLKIVDESVKAKIAFDETSAWIERNHAEGEDKVSMKKKLEDCYNKCIEVQKKTKLTEEEYEQVWSKLSVKTPNREIPTVSSAIGLEYSESHGRHYIATRDIEPGEVLLKAPLYAHVCQIKTRYQLCWECHQFEQNCIPCDFCKNVIFCSVKCKEKAWKECHYAECVLLPYFLNIPRIPSEVTRNIILAFRIICLAIKEYGTIERLRKALEEVERSTDPRTEGFTNGQFHDDKYMAFFSLKSHPRFVNDFPFKVATDTIYEVATKTTLLGKKYNPGWSGLHKDKDFVIVVCLFVKNWDILDTNGVEATRFLTCKTVNPTGVCLPITASLFNHSCYPNVYEICNKSCSMAFAIVPINKGEQVFVNYMETNSEDKKKRQAILDFNYNFTCKCIACTNDWPRPSMYPTLETFPARFLPLFISTVQTMKQIEQDVLTMDIKHVLDGGKSYELIPKRLSALIQMLNANFPQPLKEVYVLQNILIRYFWKFLPSTEF